jgi:hypothetical protein
MAQAYKMLRIPTDVHEMLCTLAEREVRTLTATLRWVLSQQLSTQPNVFPTKDFHVAPSIPKRESPKAENPTVRADLVKPLVPPKPAASEYAVPRVITAEEFDRL